MHSIVVIGKEANIEAFKALGVEIIPVVSVENSKEALDRIVKEGVNLVFIEETYFESLLKEVDKFREKVFPVIIPIPGEKDTGFARERLRMIIKKAVGTDIF